MPKYLIERHLPGAGALPAATLQEIAKTSVGVVTEMGPAIQWVQSYVSADAIHCVSIALDEDAIREHGRRGGFTVTRITEILEGIEPTTAEGPRSRG